MNPNPALEAKQLLQAHSYEKAEAILVELYRSGRATAESCYLLGSLYHRQNRFPEAVESFQRSLMIDPQFTDSAISLSIIYNDTGHYSEGKAVFEHAQMSVEKQKSKATPSVVVARELSQRHAELGQIYRKLQRFDEAATEFLKSARLDPQNVNARIELAKTHAQRGNAKLAHEELQSLIQEFPENVNVRVQLALWYYSQGNVVEAQIELNQALIQDPSNVQVKTYLTLTQGAAESTV